MPNERYYKRAHLASEFALDADAILFTYMLKKIPNDDLPLNYQEAISVIYQQLHPRIEQFCSNSFYEAVFFKIIYPAPGPEAHNIYHKKL